MKDVLEYLFGQLRAERQVTHKVGSVDYAVAKDGTLGEPVRELAPQWTKPTLIVGTLAGLVRAEKAGLDRVPDSPAERLALQIVDTQTVQLISLLADDYGRRHIWVCAKHKPDTKFVFGAYYKPEAFLIAFRSSFLFNDQAAKVQQLCSMVTSGQSVQVADDGVSQEIVATSGTVTKAAVTLPAEGVPLIPWRTFREAAPVESKFLLRMRGVKDSLPEIALFEIDAKWELDTIGAIASYLAAQLPKMAIIA